jgi:hypothetical protein
VATGSFEDIVLGSGETYRPLVPKRLIAIYKKGSCFGETNLLHGQQRQTTVVSSGVGTLGVIPKRDYLVRFSSDNTFLLQT